MQGFLKKNGRKEIFCWSLWQAFRSETMLESLGPRNLLFNSCILFDKCPSVVLQHISTFCKNSLVRFQFFNNPTQQVWHRILGENLHVFCLSFLTLKNFFSEISFSISTHRWIYSCRRLPHTNFGVGLRPGKCAPRPKNLVWIWIKCEHIKICGPGWLIPCPRWWHFDPYNWALNPKNFSSGLQFA